jgi:hypothetical protein
VWHMYTLVISCCGRVWDKSAVTRIGWGTGHVEYFLV